MRLILLGPPGAGKGSQAQVLSERLGLTHIASGDLLRHAVRAKSPLGLQAEQYMSRGELVPDRLVTQMVLEHLAGPRGAGVVLDGFPRTQAQAVELDHALDRARAPIDLVLYLRTSHEMIVRRLAGRWICRSCDANYHTTNLPPKRAGICDRCGGPLEQREDDRPDTIRQRLRVYETQTAPLLTYYRDRGVLHEVNGDLSVEALFRELGQLFRHKRLLPEAAG